MPRIEVEWDKVNARGQQIRQLLKPISRNPVGPAWQNKSIGQQFIIGTHDGSPPSSHYGDWRFATKNNLFRARYYEIWIIRGNLLTLEKAYFQLYKKAKNAVKEGEYLLLHCDPNEPDDAAHAHYKRGPHFHIVVAEDPLPHSHIALCLVNLDEVLLSLENLTNAMNHCILMIKEQFLDLIK